MESFGDFIEPTLELKTRLQEVIEDVLPKDCLSITYFFENGGEFQLAREEDGAYHITDCLNSENGYSPVYTLSEGIIDKVIIPDEAPLGNTREERFLSLASAAELERDLGLNKVSEKEVQHLLELIHDVIAKPNLRIEYEEY